VSVVFSKHNKEGTHQQKTKQLFILTMSPDTDHFLTLTTP